MSRKRITLKIKGEAYNALMELSRVYGFNPQEVVEKLLISHQRSMRDDELCRKEFFRHSIVYSIELPFSFPFECEVFELQVESQRRAKIYVERVPKRHVYGRLPFRTLVTIVIELTAEERQSIAQDMLKARGIGEQHVNTAFELLKALITGFRRITEMYYNIGVIEPPANLEEFERRVEVVAIIEGKPVNSYRFMPVKVDSMIYVGKQLEEGSRNKILGYMIERLSKSFYDPLSSSREYLDVAIISCYKEQWNLAILQGIIAMETMLSNLVFNTPFKNYFIEKYRGEGKLREKYRDAQSLLNKIEKFLFPLLKNLCLSDTIEELRKIMRDTAELYNLRSKIVHEGIAGNKKDAERAVDIARKFLRLIDSVIKLLRDKIA